MSQSCRAQKRKGYKLAARTCSMNGCQCPIRSSNTFHCLPVYMLSHYFCTCALALLIFFLLLLLTFSFSLFAESTLLSLHSLDRSHLRHQQSKSISTSGPISSSFSLLTLTSTSTLAHKHIAVVFY